MVLGEKLLILILLSEHEDHLSSMREPLWEIISFCFFFFLTFWMVVEDSRWVPHQQQSHPDCCWIWSSVSGGFPDFWPRVTEIYKGWRIVRCDSRNRKRRTGFGWRIFFLRRCLLKIDFSRSFSWSGRCLVEFLTGFFVLCEMIFPPWIHAESSGKSTATPDNWNVKLPLGYSELTTRCYPGDLGFTALEKDRDRSTGFLIWNLRFASGKETFSVTLIFWISLSRRNVDTCCRWLGDRLRNSHSAVVCRRVVGRELMIRTSRKPRLRTYIAAWVCPNLCNLKQRKGFGTYCRTRRL